MAVGQTYSFKALTGVITNPVFGVTIPLTGGNLGAGKIDISMTTVRTEHDVAADGTVMPSYIAGDNGSVMITVQETSSLHSALLALYNACLAAASTGQVAGWAANTISFRLSTDNSVHVLTGVSFEKFPDKPYQAKCAQIDWKLLAANITNQ
jgi:hypothetical protein